MRPGYKQTEVGPIPQDWDMCLLGNVLKRNPQYGINAPSVKYQDNLPTYIRITDISDDGLFEPDEMVAVDHRDSGQYYLEEGDLVFARTGASVGKSYRYNPMDGKLVFAGFLIRVTPDERFLHPGFLAQYVKTQKYWNWVRLMSMRSGQPGINGNEYGQLPLPLPSLKEQRAIAEVLGDVDDLLASLDGLIAKKRAVKLATMQQLLTGEKRLAGWNGRWETKTLREIAKLHRDNIIPANYPDELFVHFSLPAFDSGRMPVTELGSAIGSNKFRVPQNAILMSKLNPRIPRVWAPHEIPSNSVSSTEFLVLTPREYISRDFLFVICSSSSFHKQMDLSATGTTGSHQRINPTDALDIEFAMPANVEEQRAIATILSDIDAEISALQARRDKTAAIKQGMMQQLLTGQTRLTT
jgi:type I restriction enzyme, S subunit